ncbi:unnamed protein product, partial [marine sediment metagenome]
TALERELSSRTLIARIAAIVTRAVSMTKVALIRFNLMLKNGADSTAGGELAILNCLDEWFIFNIRFL